MQHSPFANRGEPTDNYRILHSDVVVHPILLHRKHVFRTGSPQNGFIKIFNGLQFPYTDSVGGVQVRGDVSGVRTDTTDGRRNRRPLEGEAEEIQSRFFIYHTLLVNWITVRVEHQSRQIDPLESGSEPCRPNHSIHVKDLSIFEAWLPFYHAPCPRHSFDFLLADVCLCETNQWVLPDCVLSPFSPTTYQQ